MTTSALPTTPARSLFSTTEYSELHRLVFRDGYAGYRPTVRELPNGDGKVDHGKRYAHVAMKYLPERIAGDDAILYCYLARAHQRALAVATALGVPDEFMPDMQYGALRVLEYPAGEGGHAHTDFDLLTLMCYRDQPDRFVSDWHDMPEDVQALGHQTHLGEIGELLALGRATRHEVLPSAAPQHSIVYFALPSHAARLSDGRTVGEWLSERMSRSRVEVPR
jgi:phosphohistidine phosphatase SixA